MQIAVHGRHMKVPTELQGVATEKVGHLERFLDGTERAEVLFSKEHASRNDDCVCCEVVIVARGRFVRARASGHLPAIALEAAIDKETQRLTRMKDRLVHRSRPRHKAPGKPAVELRT